MSTKDKKKDEPNQNQVQKKQSGCGCGDIVNDFIEDIWTVMTPGMIDRLKCVLRNDMGLSKEDVDQFIASQREIRRQRICLKKIKKQVRIGPRNLWIKELSKDIADQMASFMVGILLSNKTARTKRITEKVLEHLCEVTGEDTTIENAETRIERTLVVVADRMAKWIDEAITDMEQSMCEKYMSAASLEALTEAPADLCHIIQTPSSSEISTMKSEFSLFSEGSQAVPSDMSITSEVKEAKKRDKKKEKEGKGDKEEESEITEDESSAKVSEIEGDEEIESEEEEEVSQVEDEEEAEETEEGEEEEDTVEEEEKLEEDEVEEEESVEDEETTEELEEAEEVGEFEDMEQDEIVLYIDEEELGSESKDRERDEEFKEQSISETSSDQELKKLPGDILDLLKEDIGRISKEEESSERQNAMKEVIDRRLEKIAREKLAQSLNSLVRYDIDEAASIVANWVEKVLASTNEAMIVPRSEGPAFEVKRKEGSQYQIKKISSTSVAQKVAEVRGIDLPLRRKKIPKTMSPMNFKSGKDWADWALDAANKGEEWGNWLDNTISEIEEQILSDKSKRSHRQNYDDWKNWTNQKSVEALKWRVEKQKIKDEGKLWKKKLESGKKFRPELQTEEHTY